MLRREVLTDTSDEVRPRKTVSEAPWQVNRLA